MNYNNKYLFFIHTIRRFVISVSPAPGSSSALCVTSLWNPCPRSRHCLGHVEVLAENRSKACSHISALMWHTSGFTHISLSKQVTWASPTLKLPLRANIANHTATIGVYNPIREKKRGDYLPTKPKSAPPPECSTPLLCS